MSNPYGSITPLGIENVTETDPNALNSAENSPLISRKDHPTTTSPTTSTIEPFKGTATLKSEVASITKNLVGSGVLSLSGGIARYSDDPSAIISATLWVIVLGTMFAYFCILIGKVCQKTHATTYRGCWEATMGSRGGSAVAFINMMLPMQGDVAYATVLSQTMQSLLETLDIHLDRITCLLLITVVALLPLCWMKNLDALAPFSALGIVAVVIAMISMIVRCVDGSYQPGGKYYALIDEAYQPDFGHESHTWSLQVLPFVCMTYQAWVMHYNAPRFYAELKDATISRYGQAVGYSFGISASMYIVIAAAGYWTFGGQSDSYILNNYSPQDPLATVSRIGIFFSTLLIYPLAFVGFRDATLDLFQIPVHQRTDDYINRLTLLLMTILTILSACFDDLGMVNAVGGGLFATFACVVFPAVMYRESTRLCPSKDGQEQTEVTVAMFLMGIGVVLGLVGAWQTIKDASA